MISVYVINSSLTNNLTYIGIWCPVSTDLLFLHFSSPNLMCKCVNIMMSYSFPRDTSSYICLEWLCIFSSNMSLSTHRKKNEVLLVVFSNAVIYPWTVMVHFTYTSLANGAVMGTFRFNTTTFGALKNHLTFTVTHLFNHFFGCIAPWNSSLGRKETCICYTRTLI